MDNFLQTKALIQNLYNKKIVPNASFALIKNGQVQTNYLGNTTWQSHQPVNENNLYDIASLTKVVATTMLVLKLVKEKKLSLDDTVHQWLPEFSDNRVTLRHLLTHTSGVEGYIENRNQLNPDQLKSALIHLPVTDNFDKVVKYTDTGLIYLGFIFEKIYQKPAQQVLMEETILPLKLNHTTFNPDKSLCIPTENDLQGIVHDPKAQILGIHCASAGLFSNLNDLVKFSQYILTSNDELLNNLFQPWTDVVPQRSIGWDLRPDPVGNHWLIYHTGFTGTFMLLDKQNQSGMIVLTNRVNPRKDNELFLVHRDYIVDSFLRENNG